MVADGTTVGLPLIAEHEDNFHPLLRTSSENDSQSSLRRGILSTEVIMKTMLEILMTAPPEQVTRCKIALVEIAHGHWDAAASTMEDAIDESEVGEWAFDCMEMRDFCLIMERVKSQGLTAIERAGSDRVYLVV